MTTQSNLTTMLRFARLHDWGRDAYIYDGAVMIHDSMEDKLLAFADIKILRDWAGY